MKKKEKRNMIAEKLLDFCEKHNAGVIPFVYVSVVVITATLMRIVQIVVSTITGDYELGCCAAYATVIVLSIALSIFAWRMEKEGRKNSNTSGGAE